MPKRSAQPAPPYVLREPRKRGKGIEYGWRITRSLKEGYCLEQGRIRASDDPKGKWKAGDPYWTGFSWYGYEIEAAVRGYQGVLERSSPLPLPEALVEAVRQTRDAKNAILEHFKEATG